MYISDNKSAGRRFRCKAHVATLRPSQPYYYANPDGGARTSIYRPALAGLGQISAQLLARKLKHLAFFPHFVQVPGKFVQVFGKDVPLKPSDMDPKIYDGPENYKIAPGLRDCLKPVMVMQNNKFRHIKVALVDLTKNVMQPEFAGSFDHKQQVSVASIAKLAPMLGAFQLHQDVWFLRSKGAKTLAELFDLVRQGLADSQLDPGGKATPFTRGLSLRGKLVLVNGNKFWFGGMTVPQLDNVFAGDPPGSTTRIRFKSTGENGADLTRIVKGFNGHLVKNAEKELKEALREGDKSRIQKANELLSQAKREFPEFRKKLGALGFRERMVISVGGDVPASNFATHTIVRDVGFPYIASTLLQSGLYDTNRDDDRRPGGGLWLGTDVAGGHWRGAPGGGSMLSATAGSLAAFMTLLAQNRLVGWFAALGMRSLMQKLPLTPNPGTGSWLQKGLYDKLANHGSLKTVLAKVGLDDHAHEVALIERWVNISGGKRILLRYVAVGLRANNGAELQQLILELDKCILANNGLTATQGGHP